jgi:hypothetical protein
MIFFFRHIGIRHGVISGHYYLQQNKVFQRCLVLLVCIDIFVRFFNLNIGYLGEGFSAVIESVEAGLGAPNPHELAEMDRMAFKIKGETSDSEDG